MNAVLTPVRLLAGLTVMGLAVAVQMVLLVLLLPFRNLRIRSCNYWGKVVGRIEVWISGSPVTVSGWEHLDARRPAIYVSNHTSPMDAFLAMFLSPVGTCGVVVLASPVRLHQYGVNLFEFDGATLIAHSFE